jgi:hypothetical protein
MWELLSASKPHGLRGSVMGGGRGDLVEVGVGGGEGGDGFHMFAGGGVGEHVLEVVAGAPLGVVHDSGAVGLAWMYAEMKPGRCRMTWVVASSSRSTNCCWLFGWKIP